IMGDDEDMVKKMRVGQLDCAGISCQGADMICPEMNALQLPFLFENWEEVDYVRGKMYAYFNRVAAQNGFYLIFWLDQDFDQIYSSKYQFRDFNDFSRARFMTWYGELEKAVLAKLGADPIPVNVPEASAAIRQGVVDSLIAPALGILGFQGYQVCRYINPISIRYAPALAVFTMDAWNSLPSEYQEAMKEGRMEVVDEFCKAVRRDNKKALVAMTRYGLRMVDVSPGLVDEYKRRTRPVWEELAGKEYKQETLDAILAHLKEFRSR
ncbi:MAG: TRAP transporter substrate-binding protein DctP, partial [Deltaproteobacteria bacterium]|nr:TRAP transporter substrate-binding protein DctP [Deltaproteobacteria bacterium]